MSWQRYTLIKHHRESNWTCIQSRIEIKATWCSLSLCPWAEAVIEMTLHTIRHRSQTPSWRGLVCVDGKPFASSQKSESQRHTEWLRKLYFIQLISMWKITGMSCSHNLLCGGSCTGGVEIMQQGRNSGVLAGPELPQNSCRPGKDLRVVCKRHSSSHGKRKQQRASQTKQHSPLSDSPVNVAATVLGSDKSQNVHSSYWELWRPGSAVEQESGRSQSCHS